MNLAGLKSIKRIYWILGGAVLLIALLIVFLNGRSQAAKNSAYETEPAGRGMLSSTIGATGAVRARQSAVLVWQTEGRVETVGVGIDSAVTANDVLASLAESSINQSVVLAQAELITAQRELDNLTESNLTLAQALQNLADAKQVVKDAQDDYDSLTRVRVSDELIKDTEDDLKKLKDQLKFQKWVFDRFYSHYDDKRPPKVQFVLQMTTTQENIDNLTARLNWYTSRPTALQIERAQAALNVAQAKMDDAQREVDRLNNGKNIEDIQAAQAKVAAAQATLNLSKIIAPFNGIVTEVEAQPGDMVSQGTTALRIEDLTRLYVDVDISEVDINNVSEGQPVSVEFDAVPGKVYNGQIVKVNLAGETSAGAVNFPVTVELLDADEMVKPGMTCSVSITTIEIKDALLVPNRAVRFVAGNRVVYVLKDGQPVAVTIRTGATSDTYSQVVGGDLKEGDLVVLNPPSATQAAPNP